MIRAVRLAARHYLHKNVTGNGTDIGEIAIVGGTFWVRICPPPHRSGRRRAESAVRQSI